MSKKLTKEQQQVWNALKYGVPVDLGPFMRSSPDCTLSTTPSAAAVGALYFNIANSEMMMFDGTSWIPVV